MTGWYIKYEILQGGHQTAVKYSTFFPGASISFLNAALSPTTKTLDASVAKLRIECKLCNFCMKIEPSIDNARRYGD